MVDAALDDKPTLLRLIKRIRWPPASETTMPPSGAAAREFPKLSMPDGGGTAARTRRRSAGCPRQTARGSLERNAASDIDASRTERIDLS